MLADALLDPELFLGIDDLELSTRLLVDSALSGAHRSSRIGSGAEFAQHRDYSPGDDLRRVNWRLYGRSRRLYVRETHAEATMPVHVLLDASASMRIGEPMSKHRYAARLAAALAFLALRSRDPAGLRIASRSGVEALPARATSNQFHDILAALHANAPDGEGDLIPALDEAADQCRQRGVFFVLSDFAGDIEALRLRIATLREMGHAVAAVQVLAPVEVELPEHGDFDFTDPETGARVRTAVEPIRDHYAASVRAWRRDLETTCTQLGAPWFSVTTRESPATLLRELVEAMAVG